MNRFKLGLIKTAACGLLLVGLVAQAQDAKKVNPTGKWSWTSPGRDGATRTNTMTLKLDGEKLTGTVAGRQQDTEIGDAKLTGEEISFTVTREFQGNKIVQKFKGKVTSDKIVGKVESNRDGETTSRDWEAKKEVAEAKDKK